jgi:two-component system sensor histidine kinase DegS
MIVIRGRSALINIGNLDKVINNTKKVVEKSKEEIYQISESARNEYRCIKSELIAVKTEINTIIKLVDNLEKEYLQDRIYLMEVHRNFNHYNEDQIKEAYDKTHKKQIELLGKREKEKLLRQHRNHLEQNLKSLEDTIRRSEELITNVGMALKLLSNDLTSISSKICEIEQIQALGLYVIKAQEDERKRVAREIHDGPAQSMANIVMRAEFCITLLEKNPVQVREELLSLVDLVRHSLQDVRKIIFDLRPMVLDDLGLLPALKRYAELYQKDYGLYVQIVILGKERRLDNSLEVALFRVVQESLTNIRKHARASEVIIKVEFLAEKINIAVRDNGCGFDLNSVLTEKRENGFGLLGMRERMQLLNGKLKIYTAPLRGTEIILSLPTSN